MKKKSFSMILTAVLTLGVSLAAGTASAADNVWLFNQSDTAIKPCFEFSQAMGWMDFGGVAAHDRFLWDNFRQTVENELGLSGLPKRATVRFTAVAQSDSCPTPSANIDEDNEVAFRVDGKANVYLMFKGRTEVRKLGVPDYHRDRDGRGYDR